MYQCSVLEEGNASDTSCSFHFKALKSDSCISLMSDVIYDPRREPINRDAAAILRRSPSSEVEDREWTERDIEKWRWAGAISRCPNCGDRAYEGGFCFGCGRPLMHGSGALKKARKRVVRPNQALEPTSTSVTIPADAGIAPAVGVAQH
jgi:hypothetical protein